MSYYNWDQPSIGNTQRMKVTFPIPMCVLRPPVWCLSVPSGPWNTMVGSIGQRPPSNTNGCVGDLWLGVQSALKRHEDGEANKNHFRESIQNRGVCKVIIRLGCDQVYNNMNITADQYQQLNHVATKHGLKENVDYASRHSAQTVSALCLCCQLLEFQLLVVAP